MRNLFMGIMLLASFNASALDCGTFYTLGERIMIARQNGMPITEVLKITENFPELKDLVIEAYKQPKYGTPEYQQEAVNEFATKVFIACEEVGDAA